MSNINKAIKYGLSLNVGMFDMLGIYPDDQEKTLENKREGSLHKEDRNYVVSWATEVPKCVRDQLNSQVYYRPL